MPSSGMLRRVALVTTDISEERIASIFRENKNRQAKTSVSSNKQPKHIIFLRSVLMMEGIRSSETSVLTRVTQRNIPEGGILLLLQFDITVKSI
jgi:hypothetical protein